MSPLQILALGMLFRTSYKMSDSVTRATGAVYARAWRQAFFAGAVALGALIGRSWGVVGVSLGVTAAVTANFLLMAQLSLRLTGISWSGFLAAHLPGLALAAAVGVVAWALTDWLREMSVAPLVLVLDVGCVAAVEYLLLVWLLPSLFLGPDGRSVLRVLGTVAPGWLRRRDAD